MRTLSIYIKTEVSLFVFNFHFVVRTIVLCVSAPGEHAQLTTNESIFELVQSTNRETHVRRSARFTRALLSSFRFRFSRVIVIVVAVFVDSFSCTGGSESSRDFANAVITIW